MKRFRLYIICLILCILLPGMPVLRVSADPQPAEPSTALQAVPAPDALLFSADSSETPRTQYDETVILNSIEPYLLLSVVILGLAALAGLLILAGTAIITALIDRRKNKGAKKNDL